MCFVDKEKVVSCRQGRVFAVYCRQGESVCTSQPEVCVCCGQRKGMCILGKEKDVCNRQVPV